jgi:hypothetical protein
MLNKYLANADFDLVDLRHDINQFRRDDMKATFTLAKCQYLLVYFHDRKVAGLMLH